MLAQWDGEPTATMDEPALAEHRAQFLADYDAWIAAGGRDQLARLADELLSLRIRLGQLRQERATEGDLEAARALTIPIEQVDASQAEIREALETADYWAGIWDTLAGWYETVTAWTGLGAVVVPLAISAAVALSAIAALAHVVRTWRTESERVAYFRDLTDRVAARQISETTAAQLATAFRPTSGGLLDVFTEGARPAVLAAIGLGLLLLWKR